MSFLSKLFGGGKSRESKTPRDATNSSVSRTGVSVAYHEDVEVAGESYHRRGISSIFLSLGRPEGGVTTQLAELIPEPQNRYDRNAVRVVVNGNQVGHIPQEVSSIFRGLCDRVGRGNVATVPARIWARNDDGTWRARVTLMFSGEVEAEKDYAAERRDAEEQRAAREAARLTKAAEREAKEKLKEARRSAGAVDGQYWQLFKPAVSELKRQKRFEEAVLLLEKCVDASEREAQVSQEIPDPWPSEQLSVVLRRLRAYPRELEFLERYVAACGGMQVPEAIVMRLNRSRLAVIDDSGEGISNT